jgi:ubiquinone/menaquinone biosynthesis C-methylase UbiE
MHLNSELLFRKYAAPLFQKGKKVLEIGPAGHPSAYNKVINDLTIEWDTVDFADTTYINAANEYLTYKLTDPYKFPIDDNLYDIVLSGQVIEHVQKVWLWLKELKRVTKEGGLIIIINPVSWPYHEAPFDCWRIFPHGIQALAEECQLEVVSSFFESLEKEQLQQLDNQIKFIPGRSYNFLESIEEIKKRIHRHKTIRRLPVLNKYSEISIEVAYDTISVLKKN